MGLPTVFGKSLLFATLARQHAYRNAQPTSHETFLLPSLGELELKSL